MILQSIIISSFKSKNYPFSAKFDFSNSFSDIQEKYIIPLQLLSLILKQINLTELNTLYRESIFKKYTKDGKYSIHVILNKKSYGT